MNGGEIMAGPWGRHVDVTGARADRDAGRAVTALYGEQYSSLVRLASLLVPDTARAEEVVQDSFVALHASWRRLRASGHALCYLRQCVVSRSRSVRPRRSEAGRDVPGPATGGPGADPQVIARPGSSAVIAALRALPARQREALVMRCYAEFSEAEIAGIMRISERAVRQHTERALAALRAALDTTDHTAAPGLLIAS